MNLLIDVHAERVAPHENRVSGHVHIGTAVEAEDLGGVSSQNRGLRIEKGVPREHGEAEEDDKDGGHTENHDTKVRNVVQVLTATELVGLQVQLVVWILVLTDQGVQVTGGVSSPFNGNASDELWRAGSHQSLNNVLVGQVSG